MDPAKTRCWREPTATHSGRDAIGAPARRACHASVRRERDGAHAATDVIHRNDFGPTTPGRCRTARRMRRAIYRKIKFEQFSETTPMSIDAIEAELRQTPKRGYHHSSSEYIADLAGISLSLPLGSRQLSIVVAGPTSRCLERRPITAAIMQEALQYFVPGQDN